MNCENESHLLQKKKHKINRTTTKRGEIGNDYVEEQAKVFEQVNMANGCELYRA